MSDYNTNSIRYPQAIDEKLGKLALGLGRTKKELFCQMVEYFYRSKKDPLDKGDELLKKDLSSGISRIISFIRQQEKDFLLPVLSDAELLKASALRQIELLEGIGKHLLTETQHTLLLVEKSDQLLNGLKYLVTQQKTKIKLKEEFLKLLEYYIARREEMGWNSSSAKKDELLSQIKQAIKDL